SVRRSRNYSNRANTPLWLLLAFVVIVAGSFLLLRHPKSAIGDHITVYYTKTDGKTVVPWTVSMRPAQKGESPADRLHYAVLYGATQAVAGPDSSISAIRFPVGTHVRAVNVAGNVATIDLSADVKNQVGGSLAESGEFKALVWTLTALPGIEAVSVKVDGVKVDTLPGGHLELDQPLRRSDW
ncbi:MAG: GerMN domain-containing protein, partial [Candidatus Eremiobacteraeota bacterium]|nr:GerMN domain-containing protein [Candidatus Eremiobacteraeota bacterium]